MLEYTFQTQYSVMVNCMLRYHVLPRHQVYGFLIVNKHNIPDNVTKNIVYMEVFNDIPTPP